MLQSSLLMSVLFVGQAGPAIDPPVANRPADFSNIVGSYDIKVSAAPTDVQVEDAVTLTIEIKGTGPERYEPNRKYLRLFPDSWKRDFYVQELPEQHEVRRDQKTWLFVYRLKPKHVRVNVIDEVKLVYYNPAASGMMKYLTKYGDPIPIRVAPRPDRSGDLEIPFASVPDTFLTVASPEQVLGDSTVRWTPAGWMLYLLIVAPPLACLASVIAWRRFIPDERRRETLQRESAAERALADLQSGGPAWFVLNRYLHERLDLPVEDPSPAEIFTFLKRRGLAIARCEQARIFFEACDAARFTGGAPARRQLADDAARLIRALEADPCV